MVTGRSGIPCMIMRGGTSKGLYFLADDLPGDREERDELLLRIMGSPDHRQIDGLGGAHPLTSKVAVVSPGDDGSVDYLFLQVFVDQALVSDQQNCGNILAGVGPFAIERGLVAAGQDTTSVHIAMANTGGAVAATVRTPGGEVTYDGDVEIAGVPGTAAPVVLDFQGTAGSTCGSLLPTGQVSEVIDGVSVTCVDNGMPVVVMPAAQLGVTGVESPEELENDASLRRRLEALRLEAGRRMGLGDVSDTTVPKLTMVSPPRAGGACGTRTFIPHRCHTSIGVLGAASVAAALRLPGSAVDGVAELSAGPRVRVEHPTGYLDVEVELDGHDVTRTGVVRTARRLIDGIAYPR
ncbi:4-oxalomesaconate tautomerase [Nonomuraea deserti]|uniref:4-oxalomesaconate tautomerase n=1 Tax=Nonomuraea deserti TaxID=1848322 RepID=A0A4R4VJE7_9ACTN|nr:4-oxalomesaconate tautomerase [Nonomuraea deserti]